MKRLLLLACLLAFAPAQAAVTVRPDSYVVDEGSSFRLTIDTDVTDAEIALDLTPLERDFEVLSRQSSSRISIVNGRMDSSLQWVITLRPRRSGEVMIPALTLGQERTEPLTIAVRPLDPALRDALAQSVYFETSVTPEVPYVQAQALVRRALYYTEGTQLYGELPQRPEVADAIVVPLGEPVQTAVERDGRRYGVVEERFAVFAERSGPIVVPGVSITASVVLRTPGGDFQRTERRVSADPITIQVATIPATYPADAPWLPAASVEILEDWPHAARPLDVGTPRRRTLLVRAEGTLASSLPPLDAAYPAAVRLYPEPPELRDQPGRSGVVALRTESADLVTQGPGTVVLPSVSLTWWDTRAERVRTTTLDARSIEVVGEPIATPEANPEPESKVTSVEAAPAPESPGTPTRASSAPPASRPILVGLGAALALVVLAAILHRLRTMWHARRAGAASALRALAQTCRAGDPLRVRSALEGWLTAHYGCGLDRARAHFRSDAAAHAELDALDRALYGQTTGTYRGDGLLAAARHAQRRGAAAPRVELPALYPTP